MPIYPYSFQLPPLNVQDIPNDGAVGEFLGISAGGVLDWLPVSASGSGDMLKSENLSGLADYPTARTNLGLGTTDSPTFKNLTISTGTITTSAPVTISQTWNAGSNVMTALKVVATDTASGTASNLLDVQTTAGGSWFAIKKGVLIGGYTDTARYGIQTPYVTIGSFYNQSAISGVGGLSLFGKNTFPETGILIYNTSGRDFVQLKRCELSFNVDNTTVLSNDGNAQLALRNGAAAQTFNVYGTYTASPLAYSRLAIACDTSGNATLTTQSTGTAGTVSINGVPVGLGKGNISSNVAIGPLALSNNSTGDFQVAVGRATLTSNTSGNWNTAIGNGASFSNTVGTKNVSVGESSLLNNTTGSLNTALGHLAGASISSGNNIITNSSVFLGALTKANASGETNQIVIGYDATGLGSNTAVLGNASITTTALRGNVGIGTTVPTSPLTIQANAGGTGFNILGMSGNFTFQSGGVLGANLLSQNNTSTDGFLIGTDTGASNAGAMLRFQTKGFTRAVIDYLGNVGIGTTAPTSNLTVAGTFNFGSANGALPASTNYGGHLGSTQYFGLRSTSAVSTTLYLVNDSSGSKNAMVRLLGSGAGADHGGLDINTIESSPIIFTTGASSERMRISAAGNVGIGTTAPSSKLHVVGSIAAFKNATDYTINNPAGSIGGYLNATGFTTQLKFDDGSGNGTGAGLYLPNNGIVGWQSLARTDAGTTDTILLRDGEADHLAMRRTTNGQKFSVYGTYPGAAWERFTITAPTSGNVLLGTYKGTGGIARGLEIQTDGTTRISFDPAGNNVTFQGAIVTATSNQGIIRCGNNTILAATNDGSVRGLRLRGDAGSTIGWAAGSDPTGGFTTAIMQLSAGLLALGDGTLNSFAGSLKLTNIEAVGDVEVSTIAKGIILKSPDGTRYRVTVANGGTLSVAAA